MSKDDDDDDDNDADADDYDAEADMMMIMVTTKASIVSSYIAYDTVNLNVQVSDADLVFKRKLNR